MGRLQEKLTRWKSFEEVLANGVLVVDTSLECKLCEVDFAGIR
jgi:hypothetical protein